MNLPGVRWGTLALIRSKLSNRIESSIGFAFESPIGFGLKNHRSDGIDEIESLIRGIDWMKPIGQMMGSIEVYG